MQGLNLVLTVIGIILLVLLCLWLFQQVA